MEAINNPTQFIPGGIYQKFLIMDILHKNKEEISNMDLIEYLEAVNYCWITYIFKNNLSVKKKEKEIKPWNKSIFKNKKNVYTFQHPEIDDFIKRSVIKDFQEGNLIPQKSYIPKRVDKK